MGYKFEKKQKGRKAVGSSLDDKAMAGRMKQEADRFKYATDADFWRCLCFLTEADKAAFIAETGLPDRKFVTGEELTKATEPFKPQRKRRGFPSHPILPIDDIPDLFASIPYGEVSLEEACYMEADAILEAFRNAKPPEPCKHAVCTGIYICAVFQSTEEAEAYLDEMNLRKHGDKYIDASAWLKEL